MANRIGTFPTFAPLAPPWSLPTLDSNFVTVNTAINDSSLGFNNSVKTDTGTANNYIVSCPFGSPTAYNEGMLLAFLPANTNTGGSSITVSPLGSISILDWGGNALVAGAIQAGKVAFLTLINSAFRLPYVNPPQGVISNNVVTVAGTTTINCLSASDVSIIFDATGAPHSATFTIALTNVAPGAHFDVNIYPATVGQVFKWSGTDNLGNTINPITSYYANGSSSSLQINLISTGDSFPNIGVYSGSMQRGQATPTSTLLFIAVFH